MQKKLRRLLYRAINLGSDPRYAAREKGVHPVCQSGGRHELQDIRFAGPSRSMRLSEADS